MTPLALLCPQPCQLGQRKGPGEPLRGSVVWGMERGVMSGSPKEGRTGGRLVPGTPGPPGLEGCLWVLEPHTWTWCVSVLPNEGLCWLRRAEVESPPEAHGSWGGLCSGGAAGSEQTQTPMLHWHTARPLPVHSSWEAVSKPLGPGAPGLSRILPATSMAMWLRAGPRMSEMLWRPLTRLPPGRTHAGSLWAMGWQRWSLGTPNMWWTLAPGSPG